MKKLLNGFYPIWKFLKTENGNIVLMIFVISLFFLPLFLLKILIFKNTQVDERLGAGIGFLGFLFFIFCLLFIFNLLSQIDYRLEKYYKLFKEKTKKEIVKEYLTYISQSFSENYEDILDKTIIFLNLNKNQELVIYEIYNNIIFKRNIKDEDAYILGEFLPDSRGIFKRSKQSKYEKFPSYIAYLKEMENTYFNNK